MSIRFYFGPDKVPFSLGDQGQVIATHTMPYHGIISRGLLRRSVACNITPQVWHTYGHTLAGNTLPGGNTDETLLRALTTESLVLSFGQSATCVRQYLQQFLFPNIPPGIPVDVWNVKEGHTTSVWKIAIAASEHTHVFALQVARDYEASQELQETFGKMASISKAVPDINMSHVYDVSTIHHEAIPFAVAIARTEWIDHAYELHCRKQKDTGAPEYLLVERFLTNPSQPTAITSVMGRLLSPEETGQVTHDIHSFLTNATTVLHESPSLNINEGDVVWNGQRALIVAIS